MTTASKRQIVLTIAMIALVAIAYQPAWHGAFLWDDDGHVTREGLRSVDGLARIWFDLGATQQYYPLTHSAFWAMHRLWGDHTTGYHAVNIVLHAISAALVVLCLRRLAIPGALLTGLLFALHPVHVESVAWITELKNTLSGVLYIAAAFFYLEYDHARRTRPYVVATVLFALALLAKTVTATLPIALLVLCWWKRGRISWRDDVQPLVPWIAAGAVAGLTTAWVERHFIGAVGSDFALSAVERVLLAGRALWFYLAKLAWPANLIFIYPKWTIDSADVTQYLYPLSFVAMVAALWALRGRTRAPLAALLFFAVTLAPALGFVDVFPFRYSYVADHFQYLASLGPIALASAGATIAARSYRLPLSAARAAGAAVLVLLALLTWQQSREYVSAEVLYRTTLQKNPQCWLALHNLGILELRPGGNIDEAAGLIAQSLQINPNNPEAHNSLGLIRQQQGRHEDALAHFREAIRLLPTYAAAQNSLGVALYQAGDLDGAMAQYRRALALNPEYPEAHRNLGLALADAGRPNEAVTPLETAIRLSPQSSEAYDTLGTVYTRLGDSRRAETNYRAALALAPNSANIRNNLGIALQQQGRTDEAIAEFSEAARLSPSLGRIRDNLGWALFRAGKTAEAERELREAARLEPTYFPAQLHLANVLHATGRLAEAIAQYRHTLSLPATSGAGRASVHNDLGVALATLGRISEARDQFRQALIADPSFSEAKANLARSGGE